MFYRTVKNGGTEPTGERIVEVPVDADQFEHRDSRAQFIAWGLKPNTSYRFRVRTYAGNTSTVYGTYSKIAAATTSKYTLRYVGHGGNDSNTGADEAHAWRTLSHATAALTCGNRSASFEQTAPRVTSLWPAIIFVKLSMTISAPSFSG